MVKIAGSTPEPVFEGDNPSWTLQSDEFYVRDVSGKEIALYSGSSLTQWNIWGLDNVGKINADTTRNYYLKDHLGSVRVVLNSVNSVVSAQDYDAWGYPLENRTYNSSAIKYDFTGKERDDETSYDYFGARYYDSRIGRWGQVEPLLDKNFSISPYNYVCNNPIIAKDDIGNDAIVTITGNHIKFYIPIYYTKEQSEAFSFYGNESLISELVNGADDWNVAGEKVVLGGKEYKVEFEVDPIEVTADKLRAMAWPNEGENFALFMEKGTDIEVLSTNKGAFINLPDIKNNKQGNIEYGTWNFHELAHLFGFKDKYERNDPRYKHSRHTMGGHPERQKPTSKNVKKLIKKLDLNLEKQIVKANSIKP